MSLIQCQECHKEISDTAKSCPHCGFKLKKFSLSKLFILILVVCMAVYAGILMYGQFSNQNIEKAVKAVLNDPDSAKISKVVQGVDAGIFCGLVNAKNKFGAYVGDTPFMYHTETNQVEFLSDEKATDYDFKRYAESANTENFQQEYEALKKKCTSLSDYSKRCFGVEGDFDNHPLCAEINSTLLIGKIHEMYSNLFFAARVGRISSRNPPYGKHPKNHLRRITLRSSALQPNSMPFLGQRFFNSI